MNSNTHPYGYLLVHFLEDPDGYAERIYFDISDHDNPRRWLPLNGGNPILTSHIGTTGVRDPHIVRNPETGVWTIIATDLRVFGGDQGGWYQWSHHASTNLIIWQSPDLVHWSEPHMLDVACCSDGTRLELGMAWACECLWVPDFYAQTGYAPQTEQVEYSEQQGQMLQERFVEQDASIEQKRHVDQGAQTGREGQEERSKQGTTSHGAFVMYWSSTCFDNTDTEHADATAHSCVLWGVTTDFTQETYEYGGVLIDTGGESIDTTMVQRPLAQGGLRTYRITKDNTFGRGIWMDYTDATRWWEPQTQWTVIQEHIGAQYVPDGNPGGVEGPAVFANHHNQYNGTNQPGGINQFDSMNRFDSKNQFGSSHRSYQYDSNDISATADNEWYLFVDVIPSIGYQPMISNNLDNGWQMLKDPQYYLSPHTKHGGVVSLTYEEYNRLLTYFGV